MSGKNGKALASKKTSTPETLPASGLPLFFEKPAALDINRHAKAGIKPIDDFTFASKTNSIPLNTLEFVEAAKYYPIVFTNDEQSMPAALVGFEKQNYFVSDKGQWKQDVYIPAYVRKYPFIFTEIKERQQLLLCVDEGSRHFQSAPGEGVTPFYENGKPTDLTRNALEFCTAFHNHYQITRQFCEDLKTHKLLGSNQSDVKLFNGRTIRLGGFQLIEEQKVNELPDEVFLEFRKKGWLPFIYFAMMSLANWKRLVDMAAEHEPEKKSA